MASNRWSGRRGTWVCPQCRSNFLVEVLAGVSTRVRVDGIDEDGQLILGPQDDASGGEVHGYRCGNCDAPVIHNGHVVRDRKTMAKLILGGE